MTEQGDIAKATYIDYTVRMAYSITFRRKILEIKPRDGLKFRRDGTSFWGQQIKREPLGEAA